MSEQRAYADEEARPVASRLWDELAMSDLFDDFIFNPSTGQLSPSGGTSGSAGSSNGPERGEGGGERRQLDAWPASFQGDEDLLIWLDTDISEETMAATHEACNYNGNYVVSKSPGYFARWLFVQPRGDVTPYATIITGWRESKPCAYAIAAVRSGHCTDLEPDPGRPPLQPIIGRPQGLGELVPCAIKAFIVHADTPVKARRARLWANSRGTVLIGMPILVVRSISDLQRKLVEMNIGTASRTSGPVVDAHHWGNASVASAPPFGWIISL
mmetsp:Transcript_98153/g.219650  ORF Transcript_98153/g.219650 Transcript_98153/m.219650 type:complete len:271 (-) Transcript_98153:434-1246(-)